MARDNQTTVKQRAARIPLDYFRRQSALERWKGWLAALGVVVGLGYVAWAAVGGSTVTKQFSPGPLAAAHAMWDNRCDACHQPFVPLGAGALGSDPHAADAACKTCHQGAAHSLNEIESQVASCAACHRDHLGRDADLNRVADNMCTACHANLADHIRPGATPIDPPIANKVTRFLDDHPEFRSAKRDPRQIKFSHARHMRPGLAFGDDRLVLADLSEADRERYRISGQSESDAIRLDCASCHQLDHTDAKFGAAIVRPAGDYMLPIQYEAHCRACHPLSYAGRVNAESSPAADTIAAGRSQAKPDEIVPHGWKGDDLQRYVRQVLDTKFVQSDPELLSQPLGGVLNRPIKDWRLPNKTVRPGQDPKTVDDLLKAELKTASAHLRTQCNLCHQMMGKPDSLDVEPVSQRPAWFQHATFSHAAHRAVDCRSCHAGAYPDPAELPSEPAPLATLDSNAMIPQIGLCRDCHSPARGAGETARGGARFDCVECHRYHHGSEPWHGIGSSARGVPKDAKMSIEQFLRGDKSGR